MTAHDELAALRQAVRDAELEVSAARAECARAPRVLDEARGALRAYHESVRTGANANPEREAQLAGAFAGAQARITVRPLGNGLSEHVDEVAVARLEAAQVSVDEAQRQVHQFIVRRREALAGELIGRARELAAAYSPVAAAVEALEQRFAELRKAWVPLLDALELPISEVAESPARRGRFTAPVTPPAPFSVLDLDELSAPVRAQVEAGGGRT